MTKKTQKLIEKYQEMIQRQLLTDFENTVITVKDISFDESTKVAHYNFEICMPACFKIEKRIEKKKKKQFFDFGSFILYM